MISWLRVLGDARVLHVLSMESGADPRFEEHYGGWALAGDAAARFGLVNEYLAHLASIFRRAADLGRVGGLGVSWA